MSAPSESLSRTPRALLRLLMILLPGLLAILLLTRAFLGLAPVAWSTAVILAGALLATLFLPSPLTTSALRWRSLGFALLVFSVALAVPVTAIILIFGHADFFAILVNIGLGVAGTPILPYVSFAATALILWAAIVTALVRLRGPVQRLPGAWIWPAAVILAINPVFRDLIVNRYYALMGQPTTLIERYTDPEIVAGVTPPNLVFLLLEGYDRQFIDPVHYGDLAPEIRALEETSLAFTDVDQYAGTGWSIAGHAAAYCGVPLSPIFLSVARSYAILPDATCLPNVLHDLGYRQTYYSGTNKSRDNHFGFQTFFEDRRIDEVIDPPTLKPASGEVPDDGAASIKWGLYDSDLLSAIWDGIEAGVAGDRPFAIYASTTDTHGPYGGVSPPCTEDGRGRIVIDLRESVDCVSRMVGDFVDRLEREHGDANILLVVASDHLSHHPGLTRHVPSDERRNLMFIRGPGIVPGRVDKPGAMFDLFPTVLDAMGLLAPDQPRAGVGTSLMREAPTLAEEYDPAAFERLLTADGALAGFVWAEKD
ncbi:LTA synthase family protein [Jannaschia marina]|uniref:LTA synthase family protein n=1 Tax=Jannaschia marina TaxID=2741674 RepID=UPI0015CB3161|nr:LTA synthase family protein [Jannaschia marina]